MAIIGQAKIRPETRRAKRDQFDNRTYTARYLVESDDSNDGGQQVLTAPGLPEFGEPYVLGNDSDNGAFLTELVPTETAAKRCWDVAATWSTVAANQARDASGKPTKDPLTETPTLEVATVNREESIWNAEFMGPEEFLNATRVDNQGKFLGRELLNPAVMPERTFSHPHLDVGDRSGLINSAGEAYGNQPGREKADVTYRYTINKQVFSQSEIDLFINTVNMDLFVISGFGFVAEFLPGTMRITRIDASLKFKPQDAKIGFAEIFGPGGARIIFAELVERIDAYWQVNYEMVYRDPASGGWDISLLDKGFREQSLAGMKDRRSNEIPVEQWEDNEVRNLAEQTDVFTQPPGVERELGGDGRELYEKATYFEAAGPPVVPGGPPGPNIVFIDSILKQDQVWHNWRIYERIPFQQLFPTLEELLLLLNP